MKILVIGGTGHMGSFLCRILCERGHEVTVATRRGTAPEGTKALICDASDPEALLPIRKEGFDTVIEFPGRVKTVYDTIADSVGHIIGCGSLWMYGAPSIVPTPETTVNNCIFEGYSKRFDDIIGMVSDKKCPFTAIMVPNVCGPGKIPLDYMGGRSIDVHKAHKNGEKIFLPDGAEALISPTDAYDLAMLFALAAEAPEASGNQIINAGVENAMTMTRFVKTYSEIYGSENEIEYVPWDRYKNEISPGTGSWWHFYSHMCPDITKAKTLLGYKPKYTSAQAMERAVKWMYDNGMM